jgi:UDP-glucuronate decarboxylase
MNSSLQVTGPINLGNPDEYTMLELAKLVIDVVASNSGIENHPLPEDDPRRRRPAIDQARAVLGWQPTTALTDGLARTAAHFRAMAY